MFSWFDCSMFDQLFLLCCWGAELAFHEKRTWVQSYTSFVVKYLIRNFNAKGSEHNELTYFLRNSSTHGSLTLLYLFVTSWKTNFSRKVCKSSYRKYVNEEARSKLNTWVICLLSQKNWQSLSWESNWSITITNKTWRNNFKSLGQNTCSRKLNDKKG